MMNVSSDPDPSRMQGAEDPDRPGRPQVPFRNFEAFWCHYLREHSQPLNRALHVAGTAAALPLGALAILRRKPLLFAFALAMGYAPAWVGHYLVEGNRPETRHHPIWSLRAVLTMTVMALSGRLAAELGRLGIEPRRRR